MNVQHLQTLTDETEAGSGYGQFCPVAMAAEIFCTRWTALILRELLAGSHQFNDLKRGLPRISPTLLSKRLKELQQMGLIEARGGKYFLTLAGEDLRGLVMGLGFWGARWVDTAKALKNLDPSLLMWDMRRHLNPAPMPARRVVVQFTYPELFHNREWWLVIENGAADLCRVDPGYDIDLFVECPLRVMTEIWMGHTDVAKELGAGHLQLDGDKELAQAMQTWLGLSPFAAPRAV